ncbi:MAG: right-handed parallel beta-helix repeat-containing protein [Bacteroidales bacterium]|nr:right-handed parallel beta-helix repeat-containing protein [Bacteroidales bacterium]
MRKVLSFFVLAGVLLASSCSLKEDFRGNDSDFATLSFTVGEPGVSATRAIGDGTSVDALYYAVYDGEGNFIADLAGKKVGTTFPTTVEITLAKGQTYKIAFWAQDQDCKAYSFGQYGDIENIYINYAGLNNDESRDAFFKTIDHKVVGDIALDVTLERPFAQINLGVTQEDWDNAAKAGIYVAQSKLVINNAATELNLFDGKVQDPTSVEYALANIPTQTLEVDLNKDGVKEAYKYLSLSYILVADQGKTANEEGMFGAESALVNATFSLTTNKAPFEVKVDNLPVQRNWRTNVIGEVLTGDIKFNIDVDPIFDGEEIYPDTLEEELRFAALNGGTVELDSDVELENSLIVADGKDMIINLNGHSIINTSNSVDLEKGDGIIVYGNLTIKGEGTVKGNTRAVWARSKTNARVIIEGGNYIGAVDSGCEVIYASGNGVIDIYGGTFKAMNADTESFAEDQFAVLNLHENGKDSCDINVYGGTFVKFNPSNNVSENPTKDFVEKGYQAIKDGDNYIVLPGNFPANTILVSDATQLQDAINNATEDASVILTQDIKGDLIFNQKDNVDASIYGLNHKVEGTIYIYGNARINEAETMILDGINFINNGNSNIDFISSNSTASNQRYAHNVIVRNCSFVNNGTADVVALRLRQAKNIRVENCFGKNLHSLIQSNSDDIITINGVSLENCGRGASFSQTNNVIVENCNIESVKDYGYGIRGEGKLGYKMTLRNNVIKSDAPVLIRKATGEYTLNIEGVNNLITTDTYQVIVTAGDYDEGVTLTPATGNITINGGEGLNIYR